MIVQFFIHDSIFNIYIHRGSKQGRRERSLLLMIWMAAAPAACMYSRPHSVCDLPMSMNMSYVYSCIVYSYGKENIRHGGLYKLCLNCLMICGTSHYTSQNLQVLSNFKQRIWFSIIMKSAK